MTENCSIRISLDAEYNEANITTLLQAGCYRQFDYRDNMDVDQNGMARVLSISEIVNRVMKVTQQQIDNFEDDPSVFTIIRGDTTVTLWFYKTEFSQLEFNIGVFGAYCKQKEYRVDLGYYIPFFLGLCKDFSILHVSAEFFGD